MYSFEDLDQLDYMKCMKRVTENDIVQHLPGFVRDYLDEARTFCCNICSSSSSHAKVGEDEIKRISFVCDVM